MRRWFAFVLLGSAACIGGLGERARAARSQVPISELRQRLNQLSDEGFDGGLIRDEVDLAEALADAAWASGIPRERCSTPSDSIGSKERLSEITANDILELLEEFAATGTPKQRAIAILAVARVGPGGRFSGEFLIGKSIWSNEAYYAVTCMWWGGNLATDFILFNWPKADVKSKSAKASGQLIELLIEKMLDKRRIYPSGTFVDAMLAILPPDGMPLDLGSRLLPILEDDGYGDDVRSQAIELFMWSKLPIEIFEPSIVALYNRSPILKERAARALVYRGSHHTADILANAIEEEPEIWPESWGRLNNCDGFQANERLVDVLLRASKSDRRAVRAASVKILGCTRNERAVPRLTEIVESPFWTLQLAAIDALARFDGVPSSTHVVLQDAASSHWSAIIRGRATAVLYRVETGREPEQNKKRELKWFFYRTSEDGHELPLCHGEEPGDGAYQLPWLGSFEVKWTDTKVHDLPEGFPIEISEMRYREGYGSNTFFRVEDGWLFGTDLWHYDSELGFVTDDGERVPLGEDELSGAQFIIETQFGITLLAGSYDHGVLAVLERQGKGPWLYRQILDLPSDAFGYAFAPDGTLLVHDAHGAVAITKDKRIIRLKCG